MAIEKVLELPNYSTGITTTDELIKIAEDGKELFKEKGLRAEYIVVNPRWINIIADVYHPPFLKKLEVWTVNHYFCDLIVYPDPDMKFDDVSILGKDPYPDQNFRIRGLIRRTR